MRCNTCLPIAVLLLVSGCGGDNTGPSTGLLEWTFDTGLEGWSTAHGGAELDSARWIIDVGNPPGSIILDGSDFLMPDDAPNSWAFRTIELPPNAASLTFDTRASQDGALRVRVVHNGQSQTLLDWEVLAGEAWVSRSLNLSTWAGQTVTLYFEQSDNDIGVGEGRFIDNVRVTVSGSTP